MVTENTVAEELMKVDEAAKFLGIKRWTLYSWTAQRKIPFVKLGKFVRFRVSDLRAWVDKKIVKPV